MGDAVGNPRPPERRSDAMTKTWIPCPATFRTPSCARCYRGAAAAAPHRGEDAAPAAAGTSCPSGSRGSARRRSPSASRAALRPTTTSCRCTATSASSPAARLDLGRAVPPAAGQGGRVHERARSDVPLRHLEHRIVGMISHLGAMLPVADGLALAAQLAESRGWRPRSSATAGRARATSTRR